MLGFLLHQRQLGPFPVAEPVFCLRQLTHALPLERGQSLAGVCGSLDHLLRLLRLGPERILAFSADPRETALGEYKIAAIKALERGDYLRLMGWEAAGGDERKRLFRERVAPLLQRDARAFFEQRPQIVSGGPLEFALFRQVTRGLHRLLRTHLPEPGILATLLGEVPASPLERAALFRRHVRGSRRVRFAIEPLLRAFPGLLGKPILNRSRVLSGQILRTLTRDVFDLFERLIAGDLSANPAFQRHINGRIPTALDAGLLAERAYSEIRANIDRIEVIPRHFVAGLRALSAASLDHLLLGNLPDYLSAEWRGWLIGEIERTARHGARCLSYSLLPRDLFGAVRSSRLQLDERLSIQLSTSEPTHLFPAVSLHEIASWRRPDSPGIAPRSRVLSGP